MSRIKPLRILHYAALVVLGLLFAFPFYWMFVTSVEPMSRISDIPPNVLPLWDWRNYADAWNAAPWGRYFLNTVFIASAATALALVTSLFAGFAFATFRFPARGLLFLAVLMVLIIPDEVILIPQYIILGDLNWLNTYQSEVIPFGASAFGIFLLRQFFLSLPPELWDAAQMDGCSRTRYVLGIAAPMALPALITVGLYTFMGMWNQFLYPLVVAGLNPDVQPLQVGLSVFQGAHSVEWSQLAAASVFTTLPILVIFLVLQRQLVEGVASASGSVVG
jgi:multiple sugar transport system permease protein